MPAQELETGVLVVIEVDHLPSETRRAMADTAVA
jgi:hypothetical protein